MINHVRKYGPRDWSSIRSKGLLQRTGKSCRLRWVNKLRPNLKSGVKFSAEEERTLIDLQAQFGNKWAKIATYLPGRTNNDVKIRTRIKDARLLTDYIGRVEANSLRSTSTGKRLRKTLLQDEIGDYFMAREESSYRRRRNSWTHSRNYVNNGRLQLESTYLTTALINPDVPETIDYINRLKALPVVGPSTRNEPTTTIADLKLSSQHITRNSRNFTCKAKIKHIHEDRGWSYVLCSKCSNKLYPEQDNDELNFVCKDDDNITPNFRYCVNATIEDTTGSADTVFFNEIMQSIINISCKDMVTKHAETSNPKIVPQLLRSKTDTTGLLHLTLRTDGQIVVNNASDVPSTTERQSTSSMTGTQTFSPSTPVPKPGISKRPPTETPASNKKMKRI